MIPDFYSTDAFEAKYTYNGDDLGASWSTERTLFRVWAPTAESVTLRLYRGGTECSDDLMETVKMTPDVCGTWIAEKAGDLHGIYYTYQVFVGGVTNETCDPYARTTGVNGKRAMVIDLSRTDPEGWAQDTDPHAGMPITDAVIYELHVRDLSVDASSGIQNKGKYLGLIETGTHTPEGIPTGLDHIKALGVTHLHILPMYDYGSVDESRLDEPQFNWGYDPVNYNVPEGSYASDPYHGEVRVREVKQMVKGLHDNGISVVMDVVYNHVYDAESFCFNHIVPGYFSRTDGAGRYSNGSGCGNDTASERSMVRKYIVDSLKYWADEYHIDGFRFDLVGLIDTLTIQSAMEEVHRTHPNVIFYGEGWNMPTDVTKEGIHLANQMNAADVPEFSFFNDTLRDVIRGSVFIDTDKGYASGAKVSKVLLAQCWMGAPDWAQSPAQSINYVSCHDNHTLNDKIALSTPKATRTEQVKMNRLAAAFNITAQGVPFFQAGEEMLRSKPLDGGYDHNSYASPDSVNAIKWDTLREEECRNTYLYYQGLIAFRKAHPVLRMTTHGEVSENIVSLPRRSAYVVSFLAGDDIFVVFNAGQNAVNIKLPFGSWNLCVNGEEAGTKVLGTMKGTVRVEAISAMIFVRETNGGRYG